MPRSHDAQPAALQLARREDFPDLPKDEVAAADEREMLIRSGQNPRNGALRADEAKPPWRLNGRRRQSAVRKALTSNPLVAAPEPDNRWRVAVGARDVPRH